MDETMNATKLAPVPTERDRVRAQSAAAVNERLDRQAAARLERQRRAPVVEVGRRLAQLDHEWDVDRALMLVFSALGSMTLGLGLRGDRLLGRRHGWFYVLASQIGFLGLHAVAGWCPPVAVLRRLGFRTTREIDAERRALELIVGDTVGIRVGVAAVERLR